jgi:hypothetical protein
MIASPTELTREELNLLNRPEIPIESWCKGEALLGRKIEKLRRKQLITDGEPDITKNPTTQKIIAEKAQLRKLIANDAQLLKDFEFFTKKLGWEPETLLQFLYWDCNLMHATEQSIIAHEKKRQWPISKKTLEDLCHDISALSLRLDQLGKTDFCPARTVILRTTDGTPLPSTGQNFAPI